MSDPALTGRVISDPALTGRIISDLALAGRVISDLALIDRVISDLAVGDRVISDLALNCLESDHNSDHDLERRTYQNVKFSGFSIYEVKSGGLLLKKIVLPSNDIILDLKVMVKVTISLPLQTLQLLHLTLFLVCVIMGMFGCVD